MKPENKGAASLTGNDSLNISISKLIMAVQTKFRKDSVARRIFDALRQGRHLTHLDVWREYGSSRASHHIYVLRQVGVPVITDMQEVLTSDHGRKANIAVYRLPDNLLEMGAQ